MSRLYTSVPVVHVLVAVLIGPLLRSSAFILGAMLATGILLGATSADAVHGAWWFRGSALLLVLTGALHGRTRRAVRLGLTNAGDGDAAVRRVARLAYDMCALIAVIAALMEVKPF